MNAWSNVSASTQNANENANARKKRSIFNVFKARHTGSSPPTGTILKALKFQRFQGFFLYFQWFDGFLLYKILNRNNKKLNRY